MQFYRQRSLTINALRRVFQLLNKKCISERCVYFGCEVCEWSTHLFVVTGRIHLRQCAILYMRYTCVYSQAGMSRSVTIVVAYLMTISAHGWRDALILVRHARPIANPNVNFLTQLELYERSVELYQVNHAVIGFFPPLLYCIQWTTERVCINTLRTR
jgi:Dual specificity phosphatase, catalytic domain